MTAATGDRRAAFVTDDDGGRIVAAFRRIGRGLEMVEQVVFNDIVLIAVGNTTGHDSSWWMTLRGGAVHSTRGRC